MSYLISMLVLLLAIVTLTTVAGNVNPKYESARSNGFISYQQPPTTDTQKLAGLELRIHGHLPPRINFPGTPHRQSQRHWLHPPPKM